MEPEIIKKPILINSIDELAEALKSNVKGQNQRVLIIAGLSDYRWHYKKILEGCSLEGDDAWPVYETIRDKIDLERKNPAKFLSVAMPGAVEELIRRKGSDYGVIVVNLNTMYDTDLRHVIETTPFDGTMIGIIPKEKLKEDYDPANANIETAARNMSRTARTIYKNF